MLNFLRPAAVNATLGICVEERGLRVHDVLACCVKLVESVGHGIGEVGREGLAGSCEWNRVVLVVAPGGGGAIWIDCDITGIFSFVFGCG